MQFSAIISFVLAVAVSAAPVLEDRQSDIVFPAPDNVTIYQASDACGTQLSVSCCNKVSTSGDSVNQASGLLAGLLQGLGSGMSGLGLFDQCSKLNVPIGAVGGAVSDILGSQCEQNVACCQHSGQAQNGLINIGLPCIALSGLL